jgi:UDP-N-acetylmuramoylalanine--D-glutamate ligase
MVRKVAILGAGESGIGAAILGKKLGLEVFLSDNGVISDANKSILDSHDVAFEEGGHTHAIILVADLVVKSPGIPDKVAIVKALVEAGIPVVSEIEFAFRYMEKDAKVIAITGTNGKTTTTLLTYHLLKSAGLNVALGGNVGISLAGLVAEGGYDYYVVEVSSFQLDGIVDFKPNVAVLLNITPDHLDRYNYNFSEYAASKFKVVQNMDAQDCFIYCADNEGILENLSKNKIESQQMTISTNDGNSWHAHLDGDNLIFNYKYRGQTRIHKIPTSHVPLIGKHNMINSMSAMLTAFWLGVDINSVLNGLSTFVNASHRLEFSGEVDGVRFINDSKATNVDSVYYALEGIESNIIWIAGGIDKGNDYSAIMPFVKQKVKALVCLGVKNEPLLQAFGNEIEKIIEVQSADEAVKCAYSLASKGDVVLLSPACASFDLFKNYEDRGDQFKAAVKALMELKGVEL